VSNAVGVSSHSTIEYGHDLLGRVTSRNADAFGYNARSEVSSAVLGADRFNYSYDPIGNRVWSAVNTLTNTYTANRLNQYSNIVLQSYGLQPYSLSPSYDADGNMRWDGRFVHAWDAENRLVCSEPGLGGATNGSVRVVNSYDYQHRRHSKTVRRLSGRGAGYPLDPSQAGTWDVVETRTFIYDGWNLTAEVVVDAQSGTTNVTRYLWGPDVSGTLQGAGGVGGLLAVIRPDGTFFPCYDANGNVTGYVDASGTVRGHFEYDAFGNTIAMWGDLVHTFKFRFSTKYWDEETRSYYYGCRHYAPKLGCWLSRDPIGERGGENVYLFIYNNPVDGFDYLGTTSVKIDARIEKRKDRFDIAKDFLIVTATIVSPPKDGNIINFLQLKKPTGQGWSIDVVKDRGPYYYDSTELKERTKRNKDSQDVIEFGDRPGGALSGAVYFYLAIVEINRTCMKNEGVFGTLWCYDKIKILADRFWMFDPSGFPEFSFDSHAGDSGVMKSVLQSLLDSKKWSIPYLCPVKVTVE